jgi:rRNA-processing protein FCF1
METIVVSDTNILIDLVDIGLLEQFLLLPFGIHTTDIVIAEITIEEQKAAVLSVIEKAGIKVKTYTPDEMLKLFSFISSKRRTYDLHPADFSVWQYSSENDYTLLTGDGNLRKAASADGVEVHGTIFLIDKMVEYQILTPTLAADKLELLYSINSRLPKSEIDLRIVKWRGSL